MRRPAHRLSAGRNRLGSALLLATALGPLWRPHPLRHAPAPAAAVEQTRWVMGTSLRIVAIAPPERACAALAAAFARAQQLDSLLSNYQPASPLSRLNAAAGTAVGVPPALADYLRRALADGRRTDGAFDVTVGALVDLYRHPGEATGRAVTLAQVAAARAAVGWERVRWAPGDVVALPRGMTLDPGGDGKGVALDAMVAALRAHGIRDAFIDFGRSSMYGMGTPRPEAAGWSVLIEGCRGEALGVVTLRDRALATSASLRADAGGAPLRGHIVDPRTGKLVTVPRTTAVVAARGTDADVLSTALVVEGQAGLRFTARFRRAAAAVFEWTTPDSTAGCTRWVQPAFAQVFRAGISSRS